MTIKILDEPDFPSQERVTPPQDTRLGRAVTPLCEAHPGLCGLVALDDSLDAFVARYRLAEMAQRTLDVQYYIWEDRKSVV